MVADETVDAEDQHAGTTNRPALCLIEQLRACYQPEFACQLLTTEVQAVVTALPCGDDQRTLATGDTQRLVTDDRARRLAIAACVHVGSPDDQLVVADRAKRARVGLCYRADQVIELSGWQRPVDQAVGRGAPTEIRRTGFILGRRWQLPLRRQQGQCLAEQVSGGVTQFAMQRQGGIGGTDRDPLLGDYRPGIGAFDHLMQGNAGFAFAVDQHPVGRRASAITRKQRAMQVQRSFFRAGQQRIAE